ncbi:MAG: hypothetical protein AABX36_03805 [Candidatus Thermoplasmatota archaeon]
MRDVPVHELSGAVVKEWRLVDPRQLVLQLGDEGDELRLLCECGRCHWILRERPEGSRIRLVVTCHACGTRGELFYEGSHRHHV